MEGDETAKEWEKYKSASRREEEKEKRDEEKKKSRSPGGADRIRLCLLSARQQV